MSGSRALNIGKRIICDSNPTYFIADIGANHDGDLDRAKLLIKLCAEAGADAAKFQHFKAETIVSDKGFKTLDKKFLSHQSSWGKSVFEVYKDASINISWDSKLKKTCDQYGIDYMTTPYDPELVEHIDPYVLSYKIGSGDITWIQHIQHIASKGKPVLLACGASTLDEIVRAVNAILEFNSQVALLQCNTNYTGKLENFDHINLNVINTFKCMFPNLCIGLSDHTPGHATALGAVVLGCRVIEKHFTDDSSRRGPDHGFSMNPSSWKLMVDSTRELERALGNGIKRVEPNEKNTVVIQRRSIRVNRKIQKGEILSIEDVTMLRPCPIGAIEPWAINEYLGRKISREVQEGDHIKESDFE
jgi:sialic acid synthase SpsE